MQTHEVKQFNWLYQVIQDKWCPEEDSNLHDLTATGT
jgi:hypothetical protein